MSLRLRLAAALGLAFSAILVLGGALFLAAGERRLEGELQSARLVATNRVAGLIAALPAARDVGGELAIFVRSFNGDRHVQVLLIDAAGSVRSASVLSSSRERAPAVFARLFGTRPSTVVMPLVGAALPVAAAVIVVDPAAELGELWGDLLLNLSLFGLFLLVSVVCLHVVAGRSLRPLERLREAIAAIGAGETGARVAENGPPELAALARGFNDMAARLSAMDARNRRLADQLARIAEEERAELARDLHDEVGPALFAIDVDASGIERLARPGAASPGTETAARMAERAAAIRRSAAGAKLAVRRLLGQLRPGTLPGLGLVAALEEVLDGFRSRHPETRFVLEAEDGEYGAGVELTMLRAAREAVHNAVRHGRPGRVAVRLWREPPAGARGSGGGGRLAFRVTDDGGGLPAGGTAGGVGLKGMAERFEAAGGAMSVRQIPLPPGVGVEGWLPVGREARPARGQAAPGARVLAGARGEPECAA